MSKITAFLFGAFLTITLFVFALMLLVHISRVMFAGDRPNSIRQYIQFWQLKFHTRMAKKHGVEFKRR